MARIHFGRWLGAAALLLIGLGNAGSAQAEVFWTTKAVLKDFFTSSERVTFKRVSTKAAAPELEKMLGYVPKAKSYVVFVAQTRGRVDGYAVIDDEIGQHLPITIGTKISPTGEVLRTEVMAYREAYGGEISKGLFRTQYEGKRLDDDLRVGKAIDAISGATISARSMSIAVRRALALVTVVRSGGDGAGPQARAR